MTPRAEPASTSDFYSPQVRTALVLTGTGTAGAYHAGVLRALHEAGVKIDMVAGRGIGALGAVFAAIDGGQRLWEERGFWRSPAVARFYRWSRLVRLAAAAFALSIAVVVVPLAAVALGLVVFPIDFGLKMVGVGGASGLAGSYLQVANAAFAPEGLPTWLPRFVVLLLTAVALAAGLGALLDTTPRRQRGALWWRGMPPPLSASEAFDHCWRVMWDLVRGAAPLKQPPVTELARRYTELLAENLGQPGFRELIITVHDLDAGRDLVFALVSESRRRDLIRRRTSEAADRRRAEVFDLSGIARDHLADAVAAALAVPVATHPHAITFAPDSYWRGETHRLTDRPGCVTRLLEELADLGVEQAIVVSASAESPGPHALAAPRIDGRGRMGEYLHSAEAASVRDATTLAAGRLARLFTICPTHNPIGPFDFCGSYDERSDRRQPLDELMSGGYEDAYHQFIEPVVAAGGDRVGI